MTIFAIICMMVIILTLQHLVNWSWRNTHIDDAIPVILSVVSCIVTVIGTMYIIVWGSTLLPFGK